MRARAATSAVVCPVSAGLGMRRLRAAFPGRAPLRVTVPVLGSGRRRPSRRTPARLLLAALAPLRPLEPRRATAAAPGTVGRLAGLPLTMCLVGALAAHRVPGTARLAPARPPMAHLLVESLATVLLIAVRRRVVVHGMVGQLVALRSTTRPAGVLAAHRVPALPDTARLLAARPGLARQAPGLLASPRRATGTRPPRHPATVHPRRTCLVAVVRSEE